MFLCDEPIFDKFPHQERGFLGNLITGPIDLAQCMGKCVSILHLIVSSKQHPCSKFYLLQPVNPLEFAKCSVECAKGSKERGLLGDLILGPVDLAQCMGKCVSILHLIVLSQKYPCSKCNLCTAC